MASGPSLTPDDVARVKEWRDASSDRWVIVTNTTFRAALWADELYAMDRAWWQVYSDEVARSFAGKKTTCLNGVRIAGHVTINHGKNSGLGALALAAHRGAKRIILLGYDAQHTGGKTHWHGDHPKRLGNAKKAPEWPGHFARAAKNIHAEVINCSRETALKCFRRESLEDALRSHADI